MEKINPLLALEKLIEREKNDAGSLIPILQEAQNIYGHLSEKVLEKISEKLNVPLSQIYGVGTFYTQFKLEPHGKHVIKVCHGTACYVNGAEEITKVLSEKLGIGVGETTDDKLFTLDAVSCLGACGLSPVMMINSETFGRLTSKRTREIIKKKRDQG
ncbi:MAG: NADH-quinone oxidoreductase subunit NuoE [Candidatus Subteraquimicrobiales bacterium]|nr:NADH-quinone oxidoreductase subunit NuoE [Candidatus Subteraquimicrobiales bacterium]